MKPEGSLPHWREPTTCPHPEPDKSIPRPNIQYLKIHFNILLTYDMIQRHFLNDVTHRPTLKPFSVTAGSTANAAIPICSEYGPTRFGSMYCN
jgi:hypothetical protein